MSTQTVKQLSEVVGISVKKLIKQLTDAGISVSSEKDMIENNDKLLLLQSLREPNKAKTKYTDSNIKITLEVILDSCDLIHLNDLLTKVMAKQQIQPLIKDSGLDAITTHIFELVADSPEQELLAAAMLGRLAAVARKRGEHVFKRANDLFTEKPEGIESLDDGDAKAYACTFLKHTDEDWLTEYSYKEIILIDTADSARRELLLASLEREGNISSWLKQITAHAIHLKEIEKTESRLKRIRRVFGSMRDIIFIWRGEVGDDVGVALTDCLKAFIKGKTEDFDQDVLYEAIDNILSVLKRVIELRFSTALYACSYSIIENGKKLLGAGYWGRFLASSIVIPDLRIAMLESALVLARQNHEDKMLMSVFLASYTSSTQVASAIKKHLSGANDLIPHIANWWCSAGKEASGRGKSAQKMNNTEDHQIGALLIEVEDSNEVIEKLRRAVVPFLSISDPVLAATVESAVSGYSEMAQISRRLARMRKLSKTEIKGERIEYNLLEHEMIGGHQAGVRVVKVVRDGIKKEFGGHVNTLVKPLVETEE